MTDSRSRLRRIAHEKGEPVPRFDTCRYCDTELRPGVAIAQTFTPGLPDFPSDSRGITLSAGGPGQLVDVSKCPACGWSVTANMSADGKTEPSADAEAGK